MTYVKPPTDRGAVRESRLDAALRRRVPSTARLSYNPLFKLAGRLSDFAARRLAPEFDNLPPNHLRVRVGVLNRLLRNQVFCLTSGYNYWLSAFANGLCGLDSNVVELGCGYGRKARHLRDYSMQGERFTGTYTGVDVDPELLAWARAHFPAPQFRFLLSPHRSDLYGDRRRADAPPDDRLQLDVASGSQQFVFSTSLVTHLLERELSDYVHETYRMLESGGTMQFGFFCHDFMSARGMLGGRWTFRHRRGAAFVESRRCPEAAVAYSSDFVTELCRQAGFRTVEVLTDPTGRMRQSHLRCRK